MKNFIVFLIVCIAAQTTVYAYDNTMLLNVSSEKVETLEIDCGAGYLKVSGDKNLNRIEVAAEIIVEKLDDDDAQELVDNDIQLSLKKRGKKVVLISHYKKSLKNIFRRNPQVQINLMVKIPGDIDLEVEDGSGSI